jgi:hypothetical protein
MPSERNPEACEVKEGAVDGDQMLMTKAQPIICRKRK